MPQSAEFAVSAITDCVPLARRVPPTRCRRYPKWNWHLCPLWRSPVSLREHLRRQGIVRGATATERGTWLVCVNTGGSLMAKLSTKTRKSLPSKDFAGPGRSFPIQDKKHARLAISGASRSANVGNISRSTEAKIDAAAKSKLGARMNKSFKGRGNGSSTRRRVGA